MCLKTLVKLGSIVVSNHTSLYLTVLSYLTFFIEIVDLFISVQLKWVGALTLSRALLGSYQAQALVLVGGDM